jgi:predicted RNase H-like HicB family nuclease
MEDRRGTVAATRTEVPRKGEDIMKISVSIRQDEPGFVASSVAPECFAEGDTYDEALEELRRGLAECLAAVNEPLDDDDRPVIELVVECADEPYGRVAS